MDSAQPVVRVRLKRLMGYGEALGLARSQTSKRVFLRGDPTDVPCVLDTRDAILACENHAEVHGLEELLAVGRSWYRDEDGSGEVEGGEQDFNGELACRVEGAHGVGELEEYTCDDGSAFS